MEIKVRRTHTFVELKVDEIETTIFKSSQKEMEDMINHLLNVVNDLASYTDKSVQEFVEEGGF
jgi:uncharacterized lipoprotein YajG